MTIQRQYTLPNCALVLEGLSADANDPMSPMSVLMNLECRLPGATDATLTGGREFLDNLVAAVGRYAQQQLSGVLRPTAVPGEAPPLVDIKGGEGPYHHLIVRQQTVEGRTQDTDAVAPLDVKLTTVQFYDLMEAIDQLLADNQTLPDLQPQFQAISRRFVKPAEPAAKRAAPAAIGAAALAAAGIGLFFVPPPEFEVSRSGRDAEAPAATTDTGAATTATNPESPATDIEPVNAASEAAVESAAGGDNLDRLANAPAITDGETLAVLQRDLTRQLADRWDAEPAPAENLTYRVAVSENGDILGYKYQDEAALENVDMTPLAQLAFVPVNEDDPVEEPVAQFAVTFTPDGEVDVTPWETVAESDAPDATGSAEESAAERAAADSSDADNSLPALESPITDGETIRTLNSTLYDSILDELNSLSANEPLEYQVRVTEAGDIIGYEPLNGAALLLEEETPLPTLVQPGNNDNRQADYRVVFTETGVLEVSPWDGWPD